MIKFLCTVVGCNFRTYLNDDASEEAISKVRCGNHITLTPRILKQEEIRTTSSTGGEKGVKPERMSLIPVEALEIMGRLYGFGAEKYAAHNWRKGYEWSKSYDSLQRHANAFWRGEDIDEETGLPHLAGVAFHAFTLMIFMQEQPEFDDRFSTETKIKLKGVLDEFAKYQGKAMSDHKGEQ